MARRWWMLRYAGLASSTALAISACTAGALPAGDPAPDLRVLGLGAMSPAFQLGLVGFVIALLGWLIVWGRLAATVDHTGPEPGVRWLTVTGLLWATPLLLAPPLASRDAYSYACQGWLLATGSDPYTVSPAAGSCPSLVAVAPMWRGTTAPYGPFGLALAAMGAGPSTAVPVDDHTRLLLAISLLQLIALAGAGLTCWGVARLATRCAVPPARAVVLGALTPLVAVHAVSGAHNDAVLAGLVVTGLVLASTNAVEPGHRTAATGVRGPVPRPPGTLTTAGEPHQAPTGTGGVRLTAATMGGAALGLATSIKITAVVAVPFAVLLAVGATGSGAAGGAHRRSARTTVAVACGAVAAYTAVMAATGLGFGWLAALGTTAQSAQWTSAPSAVGMCAGYLLRAAGHPGGVAGAITVARIGGLIGLVAVVATAWRAAARSRGDTRTVVACCGAALGAVAVLSPVFYPWYALAPLSVLAAALPGAVASRWLVGVGAMLAMLSLSNGLSLSVVTKLPGALAMLLGLGVLGAGWWRRRLHRWRVADPCRASSRNPGRSADPAS